MTKEQFMKAAVKQGYVYEKKQLRSGWTSIEKLPDRRSFTFLRR